jgi:type I restriction enzyme M protein
MSNDGVSKVFDNSDFGYYKITVERPSRKIAQLTPEKIASLRFVPALRDVMEWAYEKWGDEVYTKLADHRKVIEAHLEKEEINLTAKNTKALLDPHTWSYQRALLEIAQLVMKSIGQDPFLDFNCFTEKVEACLKTHKVRLTASERNQLINAVSWYDEKAERVIKKVHKLSGKKLDELLAELSCSREQLADFGYWPSKIKGEYVEYESESDLRDTENVPLKENVYDYFLREVRPHVDEAWINQDQTKIGYEISFNKYFYQHMPLRSLKEVAQDILALEAETDGLLKRLVSFWEAS